jgi:hypothetical protein
VIILNFSIDRNHSSAGFGMETIAE